MSDYQRALFYAQHAEWDNLLILMVRTEDNFLAKKIEHFLHAFYYEHRNAHVEMHLVNLLNYLHHSSMTIDGDIYL